MKLWRQAEFFGLIVEVEGDFASNRLLSAFNVFPRDLDTVDVGTLKILSLRPLNLPVKILVSGKLNADTLKKGQEMHVGTLFQKSLLFHRILNLAFNFESPTAFRTIVINFDMQQQVSFDFGLLSSREQILLDAE